MLEIEGKIFIIKYFKKGVDGVNQSCKMRLLVKANGLVERPSDKEILGKDLQVIEGV